MHQLTITLSSEDMGALIAYTSHTNYCCDRANQPRVTLSAVAATLLSQTIRRFHERIRNRLLAELGTLDTEREQLLSLLAEPTGDPGILGDIHHDLEANDEDHRTVMEELTALEVPPPINPNRYPAWLLDLGTGKTDQSDPDGFFEGRGI